MGLSNTLNCHVSGQGISGLLRSGVHLSASSPFIYLFHFVCLFGKSGICSSLVFSLLLFFGGFSLPTSVLRCFIFIRGMLFLGPGASIGLTGKVNTPVFMVLRPRYPRRRWYPSYHPFGHPFAICSLGTRQLHSGRNSLPPPPLGGNPSRSQQARRDFVLS